MLNQSFIAEIKHEATSTRRILERVPKANSTGSRMKNQ
jgi:hypothetical protein